VRTTPREHTLHASTHTQHTQAFVMDPVIDPSMMDTDAHVPAAATASASAAPASAAGVPQTGQCMHSDDVQRCTSCDLHSSMLLCTVHCCV